MGLTLSRVDAAQVEAANVAIASVAKSIRGVADQFAVRLAPFIEEAARQFGGLSGALERHSITSEK